MRPLRLGFPVSVLGAPGLKSSDTRRWQSNPHLRVSLEYLHAIFDYLSSKGIGMYRMSSDIAPYASHPDMPQFHAQVAECARDLELLGRAARERDLRLSFHPSQFVVLNSPDPALRFKSIWDLRVQAEILDRMDLGPEAVLVVHVGGSYGDRPAGVERWIRTWHDELPDFVRRRLVLENDDGRFSAADVLKIHEATGVRLIFDVQHFRCFNPEDLDLFPTLRRFLNTWGTTRPKIHFSSPRTELREVKRKNRKNGKRETVLLPPLWTGHADYCHPFEAIDFLRSAADLEFDIMLESKTKDLALLRLRRDLGKYAPGVAKRFGIVSGEVEDVRGELEPVNIAAD